MSYTVLARRYRSATFDDVVGQEHVAQTLKKAIRSGRIAHAYLFCGTRGVGKTSMARILAKALNCEATGAPTDTPCGKCASCQAVARGEDIDVIEIDAASNTGVDSVRETHVTVALVEQLLGLPKSQLIFDLAGAVGAGDVKATLARADAMIQAGLSVDGLLAALVDHLRNLLIIRTCGIDSELADVPGLAPSDLEAQAGRFDPAALTQDIAVL